MGAMRASALLAILMVTALCARSAPTTARHRQPRPPPAGKAAGKPCPKPHLRGGLRGGGSVLSCLGLDSDDGERAPPQGRRSAGCFSLRHMINSLLRGVRILPPTEEELAEEHAWSQLEAYVAQGRDGDKKNDRHSDSETSSSPSTSTTTSSMSCTPAPTRRGGGQHASPETTEETARDGDGHHGEGGWEEKEGFTTYVPIKQFESGDEDDESFDRSERRFHPRKKEKRRRRRFHSECRGVVGICHTKGRREAMEDTFSLLPNDGKAHRAVLGGKWRLYGMFDGHGGDRASHYCKEHLLSNVQHAMAGGKSPTADVLTEALRDAFLKTDRHFVADAERNEWMDGTTALVAAVGPKELLVANAGDSRAVMGVVRAGPVEGEEIVIPVPMSKDHKPGDKEERKRIEQFGGIVVTRTGVARVMGVLAVARAIGDAQLKPYVTAEPDVKVVQRADEQRFIILASDGLWDVVSNKEAVEIVLERLIKGKCSDNGARKLAAEAYRRGSSDNISILVVDLRKARMAPPSETEDEDEELGEEADRRPTPPALANATDAGGGGGGGRGRGCGG